MATDDRELARGLEDASIARGDGLAGPACEVLRLGLELCATDGFAADRASQVARFHDRLVRAGLPVFRPEAAHAAFLDAGRLLPHAEWTGNGFERQAGIASEPLADRRLPEEPRDFWEILRRFRGAVAASSVRFGARSYAGHMVSELPAIGIAAEAFMAVLNQNQVSADASPATSAVERQTVRWLADLVGYDPEQPAGIGTAGGSIANLVFLEDLERRLDELDRAGRRVLALVGIAGTSETGNVDPLGPMADLAEERGLWFHVDAALGAAALASPRHRARFEGIERAHSITVDPHKWFYIPYHCAYALFREQGLMRHVELSDPHFVVLRPEEEDLGKWSVEGSRAANALKFWMVAQALGRRGYAALVDHQVELAAELARLVDRSADLERLSVPELNLLCFRYRPAWWRRLWEERISRQERWELNRWLNGVNVELQTRLARSGVGFLSRTTLESAAGGMPVTALRAVLFHPSLETADLEALLEVVHGLGAEPGTGGREAVPGRWPATSRRASLVPEGVERGWLYPPWARQSLHFSTICWQWSHACTVSRVSPIPAPSVRHWGQTCFVYVRPLTGMVLVSVLQVGQTTLVSVATVFPVV